MAWPSTSETSVPLPSRRPRHTADGSSVLAIYTIRITLGLIASLSLMLALLHLPFHRAPLAVGWQVNRSNDLIVLQDLETLPKAQDDQGEAPGAPITRFGDAAEDDPLETAGEGDRPDDSPTVDEAAPENQAQKLTAARQMILEHAEHLPSIVGGLGAYYIQIEYPQAAQDAGIEGRLVLEFVVEPDGQASDIHVLKSLHALCDSAAVRALRRTTFVPGRQNGETVRVRMRLPVRFQLLDPPSNS